MTDTQEVSPATLLDQLASLDPQQRREGPIPVRSRRRSSEMTDHPVLACRILPGLCAWMPPATVNTTSE